MSTGTSRSDNRSSRKFSNSSSSLAIDRQLADDHAAHGAQQSRRAQMHEPLVEHAHRIARLLEKENRVARVHLVRCADRLLHEREIAADEPSRRPPRAHDARDPAPDARGGPRSGERREQRRHRRVARARDEIVDRRPVKGAKSRSAHQPEMQRGDVRVADEDLRIAPEHLRLEIREHAHRAVATRAADHRLHLGVQPHPHEVLGAALILHALEPSAGCDLGVEHHAVARVLERLDARAAASLDGARTTEPRCRSHRPSRWALGEGGVRCLADRASFS